MPPASSSPLPGLPGLTLPLNFQPSDEDTEYGTRLFPTALQVQDLADGTSMSVALLYPLQIRVLI